MSAVTRRIAPLALLLLFTFSTACTSELPKQYYKPGGNYTSDEFLRDRSACTKDGAVDEQCLLARGWVPLTADEDTRQPMKGGAESGKERTRYAPK
jgi:hypothetical protein